MTIELLNSEIINQIAAGEVIENPSAVIKELVENSLDANAKTIEIDLVDAGLSKITIKDNGDGITKEDLLKAPLRHATSKIKNFNDLYSISTMGFRGEALASIFSIANTKIMSYAKDAKKAFEISSKDTNTIYESGCSKGTTIIVENLFYNTPARKKYLKSENLELKNILDSIRRFELIHFDKKIIVTHNGKMLVNKPVFKDQRENLTYILGKETKGHLIGVNYKTKGIKITGFIGNPSELSYSYKKNQYFFVNNRYIQSKILSDALYSGFTSNLMKNRHPMYCIHIEIDPEIIDVNVHPTKIEIRFENESEIYTIMNNAISEIFKENLLFKEFNETKTEVEKDVKLNSFSEEIKENKNNLPKEKKSYFNTETQQDLEAKDWNLNQKEKKSVEENISFLQEKSEEYKKTNLGEQGAHAEVQGTSKPQEEHSSSSQLPAEQKVGPLYEELDEFRLLGQLDKTYIVVQTKQDMILVDQHVAEEKYFYETFLQQIKNKKAPKQTLLKSIALDFDNSELCLYRENKELLSSIGFESDEFGENTVMVRAVPILFRHTLNDADKLKEVLYDIVLNKSIKCIDHEHHSKAASMACRMAVMAGDELTLPQMRKMVDNLRYLNEPFNCPHGRPTFLKYSFYDLQKKFKRIV